MKTKSPQSLNAIASQERYISSTNDTLPSIRAIFQMGAFLNGVADRWVVPIGRIRAVVLPAAFDQIRGSLGQAAGPPSTSFSLSMIPIQTRRQQSTL